VRRLQHWGLICGSEKFVIPRTENLSEERLSGSKNVRNQPRNKERLAENRKSFFLFLFQSY